MGQLSGRKADQRRMPDVTVDAVRCCDYVASVDHDGDADTSPPGEQGRFPSGKYRPRLDGHADPRELRQPHG